ncbi:MAG: hypothetical protein H0X51_05435 [Parachlamydiaceae bacterium]|nr:hypothetical protein [Parachlamydiaceae bacterium]
MSSVYPQMYRVPEDQVRNTQANLLLLCGGNQATTTKMAAAFQALGLAFQEPQSEVKQQQSAPAARGGSPAPAVRVVEHHHHYTPYIPSPWFNPYVYSTPVIIQTAPPQPNFTYITNINATNGSSVSVGASMLNGSGAASSEKAKEKDKEKSSAGGLLAIIFVVGLIAGTVFGAVKVFNNWIMPAKKKYDDAEEQNSDNQKHSRTIANHPAFKLTYDDQGTYGFAGKEATDALKSLSARELQYQRTNYIAQITKSVAVGTGIPVLIASIASVVLETYVTAQASSTVLTAYAFCAAISSWPIVVLVTAIGAFSLVLFAAMKCSDKERLDKQDRKKGQTALQNFDAFLSNAAAPGNAGAPTSGDRKSSDGRGSASGAGFAAGAAASAGVSAGQSMGHSGNPKDGHSSSRTRVKPRTSRTAAADSSTGAAKGKPASSGSASAAAAAAARQPAFAPGQGPMVAVASAPPVDEADEIEGA